MDQYSPAELSELFLLGQGLIDTQFQYWLTITFAVVVAGFAAGEHLSQRLRYTALVLYCLASATLFLRLVGMGDNSRRIVAVLADTDSVIYEIYWPVVILRSLTFFLGTAAASYFLLRSRKLPKDGAKPEVE